MSGNQNILTGIVLVENLSVVAPKKIEEILKSTMDGIAGPSTIGSSVFTPQIQSVINPSHNSSYYSSLEPDFQWVKASVNYLIYLVSLHFDEFYDKTLKKKVLWKKIAEEMRRAGYACTSDDCDKKWRNMKKSYVTVLQKQVQGDFSSKFTYFDQMHAFLGKEIDPLGMREQGLNRAIQEKKIKDTEEFPRVPFYEVTADNNFQWVDSAVHLLLDLILQHKGTFKASTDIDSVWESITEKMSLDGHVVVPDQCQRKWMNLSEGFLHYQAEAEASGVSPRWPFFSRVRHVLNTLNVPITTVHFSKGREVSKDAKPTLPKLKGSLTTPSIVREPPKRRRKRGESLDKRYDWIDDDPDEEEDEIEEEEEDDDEETERTPRYRFDTAIRRLQRSLNVERRLSHLESRVEAAQKQKAATKHSNNMLGLILVELRRINKSFEETKQKRDVEEESLVPKNSKLERRHQIQAHQTHHVEDEDDDLEVELSLKDEKMILNHVDEDTPIVDEAACRQAILNMQSITDFQFMKPPKVEIGEDSENSGIIIVEGL